MSERDYYRDRGQSFTRQTGDIGKRKTPPPTETNAEVYYYKKQIDSHTSMVIVLQDGEEITGTIEWYDKDALKINRKNAPNLLLLKHNIKYLYKESEKLLEDSTKTKKSSKP